MKTIEGIRITITGPAGCGKSRLLETVIAPALKAAGVAARIEDGGEFLGLTCFGPKPTVDVLVTNDVEIADAHTRGVRS